MPYTKCDLDYLNNKYPPAGGDGKGDNPCDDWPHVPSPQVKDDGVCQCPPHKDKYTGAKWASAFNIIPMVGNVISGAIGMPDDCSDEFKKSADKFQSAQKEFVAMMQAMESKFESVVETMGQIYTGETNGVPKGLLPDAVRAAIAPAMHVTVYLAIIAGAVFLVLVGVVFTM